MKRLLVVLALLLSCITLSHAAEISARFGDAVVTLTDTPCDSKAVLGNIKEEYRSKVFNGTVQMTPADKPAALCWMLLPDDGVVFVIDESGGSGPLPMQAFMKQPDESI